MALSHTHCRSRSHCPYRRRHQIQQWPLKWGIICSGIYASVFVKSGYMATFTCGGFSKHGNHLGHRKGWRRRTGFANFIFKLCVSTVTYTHKKTSCIPMAFNLTTPMWASHRQAKWLAQDHTGSQMQSTKTEHNNSQPRPLGITALIRF